MFRAFFLLWMFGFLLFCRNGAPNPGTRRFEAAVLISANAEWSVVKTLYPGAAIETSPLGEFFVLEVLLSTGARVPVLVFHGGWGKVAAAASTQYVIDKWDPALVINLGTCGGFEGSVQVFDIILVTRTVIYDIVERMGNAAEAITDYTSDIDLSWLSGQDPSGVRRGVLVSADQDLDPAAMDRLKKDYGAVAADWESGAIAFTARKAGKKVLIVRGVTDLVGPQGSEAYGNLGVFQSRSRIVMKKLFDGLSPWLDRSLVLSRGLDPAQPGGGQ